jgi:predicted Zn finger-like uncharacterized protein
MIIACTSCASKYKYDEAKLEGVVSKKVRCPKCKAIIEVFNPLVQEKAKQSYPDVDPLEETHQTAKPKVSTKPSIPPKPSVQTQPMDEDVDAPRTAQVDRQAAIAEALAGASEDYVKMSEFHRFSLAVIQGFNSGEIYSINKPKMLIGRADADIIVKDLEASRQHARIDVLGDRVILRDLNSTNGTFVNEQRISTVNLENQQEFRIGTTIFMLIITDLE